MRVFVAAAIALTATGPAAAQSNFGDTRLSYQNGVVYDDDLVPGRGPNASFLSEEQSPQPSFSGPFDPSFGPSRTIPAPSRNLIGGDGRSFRDR